MIANFNKKQKGEFFTKNLLFKTVGVIFLVIIFVLFVADFKIYQKKRELNLQIENYKKQIEDIKNSNKTIKEEIANSDNIDYLEKLGYEQFDQTRPGETEYMFVKSPKKAEVTPSSANFWDKKMWTGWLSGALEWIKSKF